MKIQRQELIKQIKAVWLHLIDSLPYRTNIAIPDSHYWLLTRRDVEWILSNTWINSYKQHLEGMDCDDSALLFHAFCRQERYKRMREAGKSSWFSFAIGQAWGTKFKGQVSGHALNIAITRDEGIILMEPSNDSTWLADGNRDYVHFIYI